MKLKMGLLKTKWPPYLREVKGKRDDAHIGAVALGEYDYKEQRASTSVVTRLGHKDDILAKKAAHLIDRRLKKQRVLLLVSI